MARLPKGLTEKQKQFCREYIYDWNATRAAKAAGYSEDTAFSIGAENLTKPLIQGYIKEIQLDLEKIAGVSRLKLANEHLKIVNTSISRFHNNWITKKEFDEISEDDKACIQQIETQTRTEKDYSTNPDGDLVSMDYIKIKLYDKQKSIDSLVKLFGYSEPERIQHTIDAVKSFQVVPASGKRTSGK
jgi:phage terminase small subunit